MAIERVSQPSDARRGGPATVAEPQLTEVVRRLVDALQPEAIYLFGSRARGDSQPDSDCDLMIVVRSSDLPPHRRAQLAHRALDGIRVAADVLVWTRQEFERFLPVVGALAATVLQEGRLLHDARPRSTPRMS
jgi:predicted nucleotidyltransferase